MRIALLALIAVLASAGAYAEETRQDTKAAPLNPLAALKPSSFQAFVERPLFSPSRRMPRAPDVEDAAPVEAAAPSVDLKLLGVTTSPDGSVALISAGGDTASQSLKQGESLEGWTITAINPSNVTLAKNGETMDLSIFQSKSDDADTGLGDDAGNATIVFGPAD